ncbi:hypothetical protein [Streptomyces sp. NPDC056244]|uniref:hypothetical protein n=1 Tax=Streptomyces sp. NPDC056244 TaxID=3345762 RepID=UPI0035E00733
MPDAAKNENSAVPFAPLHAYALAQSCPMCKASAGAPCDAPQKNASLRRKDAIREKYGLEPVDHDPTHRMHARRVDAGFRHRKQDIGRAPWPEDRDPERSYSTIGQLQGTRRPRRNKSPLPPGADLATRASAVLDGSPGQVEWPYGLVTAARSAYKTQADFEEAIRDRRMAQYVLVAWAEEHGLRQSSTGCCPRWLQRRASRRCAVGNCTRYGPSARDSRWLDHTTAWLFDGRPAVLTSAPYSVQAEDDEHLRRWTTEDSRLRTTRGTGWYGFGTTQIVLWRADLLDTVVPACVGSPASPVDA